MLPRRFRLSVQDNILALLKKGTRYQTPFFILRVRPNTSKKLRCTIVVSIKMARTAVQRHRLRRLLYDAVYTYIKKTPPEKIPHRDIAILPMHKYTDTSRETAEKMLHTILNRL